MNEADPRPFPSSVAWIGLSFQAGGLVCWDLQMSYWAAGRPIAGSLKLLVNSSTPQPEARVPNAEPLKPLSPLKPLKPPDPPSTPLKSPMSPLSLDELLPAPGNFPKPEPRPSRPTPSAWSWTSQPAPLTRRPLFGSLLAL